MGRFALSLALTTLATIGLFSSPVGKAIDLEEVLENIRNAGAPRGRTLPPGPGPTLNTQPRETETPDIHIPVDSEAETVDDFRKIRDAWMNREVMAPCEKLLGDDERKDTLLAFYARVMETFCRSSKWLPAKRLVLMGEALSETDRVNPLTDLFLAKAALMADDKRRATLTARAYEAIAKNPKYPPILRFYAIVFRKSWLNVYFGANSPETPALNAEARDALLEALKAGAFKDAEIEIAFNLLSDQRDNDETFPPAFWKKLRAPENKIDPWLIAALEGQEEIDLAWSDRGGGWAHTVTKNGWKGFGKHLEKARKALEKAWAARPELPQPAALMITVAMGGRDNGGEQLWFNRTVKARLDYEEAYKKFLWAIFPRWGGSHEQMLIFGEKCLETQRYDTVVPYYYLIAIMGIVYDSPYPQWNGVFRYPGLIDRLETMFSNYLKHPETFPPDRVRYEWALCEIWAGRYEKGRSLLLEVPRDFNDNECFRDSWMKSAPRRRADARSSIAAFTGPQKAIFERAEQECFSGNAARAAEILTAILPKIKNDSAVFAFARDWAARARMSEKDGPNQSLSHRRTPLTSAACRNDLEAATFLLDNGADTNALDAFDQAPLSLALNNDTDLSFAEFLLKRGADPNRKDCGKWTPLAHALIKKLPQKSIPLSNKDKAPGLSVHGPVSLDRATREKRAAIVHALLEHGSDPNVPFPDGVPLLYHVTWNKQLEIARDLLRHGAKIDAPNPSGWTPLMFAADSGERELVKLLLENGANVNAKNDNGRTALSRVAENGHLEIAKMLIDKGADVNVKNHNNWTPLAYAASRGHSELVKLFIDNGADVNVRGKNGATAMLVAFDQKRLDIAKLLIDNDADVNVKRNDGWAPLLYAVHARRIDLVKLLIEKGADVNIANNEGWSALLLAVCYRQPDIVKTLIAKGANVNAKTQDRTSALHLAFNAKAMDIAKLLVEKGADVNAKAPNRSTPLYRAIFGGAPDLAALLIEKGADVNAKTPGDWTALLLAAHSRQAGVAALLIEKGADVNARTKDGISPLFAAVNNDAADIVKLLIANGADVDITDNRGISPLQIAVSRGSTEIQKLLTEKRAHSKSK